MDPKFWLVFGGPASEIPPQSPTNTTIQLKLVKQIVTHPLAKEDGFYRYNFALIQLTEGFVFSDSIKSICIAETKPTQDQLCITAGWSDEKEGGVYICYY